VACSCLAREGTPDAMDGDLLAATYGSSNFSMTMFGSGFGP
jgi:hypothetical protein